MVQQTLNVRRLVCFVSAGVGFLTVSSVITMSAPFFLGKVIDAIYTNPSEDFTNSLTSLCALLSGLFLCGAAANATRVYLMQTAGKRNPVKSKGVLAIETRYCLKV